MGCGWFGRRQGGLYSRMSSVWLSFLWCSSGPFHLLLWVASAAFVASAEVYSASTDKRTKEQNFGNVLISDMGQVSVGVISLSIFFLPPIH